MWFGPNWSNHGKMHVMIPVPQVINRSKTSQTFNNVLQSMLEPEPRVNTASWWAGADLGVSSKIPLWSLGRNTMNHSLQTMRCVCRAADMWLTRSPVLHTRCSNAQMSAAAKPPFCHCDCDVGRSDMCLGGQTQTPLRKCNTGTCSTSDVCS